jgi:RHS repeat-associated protein
LFCDWQSALILPHYGFRQDCRPHLLRNDTESDIQRLLGDRRLDTTEPSRSLDIESWDPPSAGPTVSRQIPALGDSRQCKTRLVPASFLAAQNPRAEAVLPFLDYSQMIEESPVEEKSCAILTGKERDSESGLDYFGARYYWSSAGRWTSPDDVFNDMDPADPATWNRYAYVRNNPLRYVDPNGEDAWDILGGAINAIGSNINFGRGRVESDNEDFQVGQMIGDAISTVAGAAEMYVGGQGAASGVALSLTGEGAIAGVPLAVASTGLAAHGTSMLYQGASNLGKGLANVSKQSNSNEAGGTGGTSRSAATKQHGQTGQKTTTTVTSKDGSTVTYKTTPGKTGGQSTQVVYKDANGKTKLVVQEARHKTTDFKKAPDHKHYKYPKDKEVF